MAGIPFSGIQPTRTLTVSVNGSDSNPGTAGAPLKTIQAAVERATPGTAILVEAGTYTENIKFPSTGGRPDAPIWLISADGPGAAKIVAANNDIAAIKGLGTDNIVIRDFTIDGGQHGIQFSQSGSNFSNIVENIVLEGNRISNNVQDGVKISQAKNVHVIDNTITKSGKEGIDFVAVDNSVIARNDVSQSAGAAGIFAKGGSKNVVIEANHVHDIVKDGIIIGGWTGPQYFWPDSKAFEAKNVIVRDNRVEDVGQRPLNVLGGQDSQAYGNYFEANPNYSTAVNVGPGSPAVEPRPLSKNVDIFNNVFNRAEKLFTIERNSNSTDIQFYDNATNGQWSKPTGPDSGGTSSPPPAPAEPVPVTPTPVEAPTAPQPNTDQADAGPDGNDSGAGQGSPGDVPAPSIPGPGPLTPAPVADYGPPANPFANLIEKMLLGGKGLGLGGQMAGPQFILPGADMSDLAPRAPFAADGTLDAPGPQWGFGFAFGAAFGFGYGFGGMPAAMPAAFPGFDALPPGLADLPDQSNAPTALAMASPPPFAFFAIEQSPLPETYNNSSATGGEIL